MTNGQLDKIFVDFDIVLDVLCKREPFYSYAAELFTLSDLKQLELYTSPLVFANVFYILRKVLGNEKAKELLRKLRLLIKILPTEEMAVDLALNSAFADFEDALQYFTARKNNCQTILTRNVKDYKIKDLSVQTAEEFVKAKWQ